MPTPTTMVGLVEAARSIADADATAGAAAPLVPPEIGLPAAATAALEAGTEWTPPSPLPTAPVVSGAQMKMVLDVSRMLAVPTELDPLLCRIAEAATVLLNCERASIFLYDAHRKELWTKVALGSTEIRIPATAGIAGYAFTHNQCVQVLDPYKDARF